MSDPIITEAKKVFEVEAAAIQALSHRLGESFVRSIESLFDCEGKVVVSGIGKSGLIGRKIAATLSSTGTPALFVHPAECSHGDLGVIASGDVVLAISYGGESEEMNSVTQFAARKGITIIAMTGNGESTLGQSADFVLDISIEREACPLGLAPTTSTAVTLAFGDALAIALMKKKGIGERDFAEFHPGGKLGRKLLTRVSNVMHTTDSLPLVEPNSSMKDVISYMTKREVQGVAGVVDCDGYLLGVITDGDIRRRLEQSQNPMTENAESMMSRNPKTIDQNELAQKALFLMEQFQIQTLFAIEKSETDSQKARPVGLLHIQDLLRAKIR